jgi:hypothetical protein
LNINNIRNNNKAREVVKEMVDSAYIHALEGRLRIKIPQVKGSAEKALEVERYLRHLTGVESVSANPVTGSVLILYNPRLTDQESLISALMEFVSLSLSSPNAVRTRSQAATPGIMEALTTSVTASLMEVALTRLVATLI